MSGMTYQMLNHSFRCRLKETSKLHITGLCAVNSPVTGELPTQRASNAEMFPFDDVIMNKEYSCYYPGVSTSICFTCPPLKMTFFWPGCKNIRRKLYQNQLGQLKILLGLCLQAIGYVKPCNLLQMISQHWFDNGLMPSDNKPSSELMLAKISKAKRCHI